MPPRTVYRFDLVAKTCAPWRSACSSSTPATEVCDDRRCRYGGAGGVSLPQPGKHLHDVSREVVLSLPDRIERADHGSIGTRQSFSWTLARNFRQKLSASHDMEAEELREVFAPEWS